MLPPLSGALLDGLGALHVGLASPDSFTMGDYSNQLLKYAKERLKKLVIFINLTSDIFPAASI